MLQKLYSLCTPWVGWQSLFKLHFFSVAEYSNEQQFGSLLHRSEQSEIVASVDGLLPIWPDPGISPGRSTNPSGQTEKNSGVLECFNLLKRKVKLWWSKVQNLHWLNEFDVNILFLFFKLRTTLKYRIKEQYGINEQGELFSEN